MIEIGCMLSGLSVICLSVMEKFLVFFFSVSNDFPEIFQGFMEHTQTKEIGLGPAIKKFSDYSKLNPFYPNLIQTFDISGAYDLLKVFL